MLRFLLQYIRTYVGALYKVSDLGENMTLNNTMEVEVLKYEHQRICTIDFKRRYRMSELKLLN